MENLRQIVGCMGVVAVLTLGEHNPLCAAIRADPLASRPSIVLVMIDDMGYGDLSCHGSPFIAAPNLDRLHASSIRLTNFHVSPMCSPTRGQLLTGMDTMRYGSTIVAGSRMMVRRGLSVLPQHLAASGYATGIFGKWHLGDNYPHRPQDRGFQRVLTFGLQEIGSLADAWCNDYFDPILRSEDGVSRKYEGYCTDIFFDQAMEWMAQQQAGSRPYFCYMPTNVVHGPQWASPQARDSLAERFPDLSPGQIGYLAMLVNFDENMGRLEAFLERSGQRDNTILIFLSDNGGYALIGRYNAGMRDGKSRLAEGGHRVPCFIRWPGGGLPGRDIGQDLGGLTQVQDLAPTILQLCGVAPIPGTAFDGVSLVPALLGHSPIPERTLIIQYGLPEPFRMSCVLSGPWRLLSDIRGAAQGQPELYNLDDDPLQLNNLIDSRPEKAEELRAVYDRWWVEIEPSTRIRESLILGNPAQVEGTLTSAEWRDGAMASPARLRAGDVARKGVWDVQIEREGLYEFALRRWPEESGLRLGDASPAWQPFDPRTPEHAGYEAGTALNLHTAHLRLGELRYQAAVQLDDKATRFEIQLAPGPYEVEAYFNGQDGKLACPAFFMTATGPLSKESCQSAAP